MSAGSFSLERMLRPPESWPLERPPLHLETSMPGVFAVGDVRRGSVKRVASAVGDGAVVVQLVHDFLVHSDCVKKKKKVWCPGAPCRLAALEISGKRGTGIGRDESYGETTRREYDVSGSPSAGPAPHGIAQNCRAPRQSQRAGSGNSRSTRGPLSDRPSSQRDTRARRRYSISRITP